MTKHCYSLNLHTLLTLTAALLLPYISAATFIRSPASGRVVPLSLLEPHLPHSSSSTSSAASALYEVTPDGFLHSRTTRQSLSSLAPSLQRLSLDGVSIRVNNELIPPPKHGSVLRRGAHHTFIFDGESGILLSAWGPGMHLRPVQIHTHPNVLVNVHSTVHMPSSVHAMSHDDSTATHMVNVNTMTRSGATPPNATYFEPRWEDERDILFDPGFAFDAPFCKLMGGSASNTSVLVHALAVSAHMMSLTPIVSLRVGDIVGFCPSNDPSIVDAFAAPKKELAECQRTGLCNGPALRLKFFRAAWERYFNISSGDASSNSDAAYLFTGDEAGVRDDVAGAAWVASVCSPYRYGWVLGPLPVVLAHEMGHTLGAAHTYGKAAGLMAPVLNVTENTLYTPQSLAEIEAFVARIEVQGCLVSRHVGGRAGRRLKFSGFIRLLRNPDIVGTDVATTSISPATRDRVDVATLYMQLYPSGKSSARILGTTLFRAGADSNPKFPFSFNPSESDVYVPGSEVANRTVGGGLGITSVNRTAGQRDNDLVAVFMRQNSDRAFCVVGYDFTAASGVRKGWVSRRLGRTPGRNVVAIGADVGDLRGNGLVDIVVTFVSLVNGIYQPRYYVGYDMLSSGWVRGGWSPIVDLPWSTTNEIGDISVAMWHPPAPKNVTDAPLPSTRLIFWHTERQQTTGLWSQNITRATNDRSWRYVRWGVTWDRYKPDVRRGSASKMQHLSGGIALTNLMSTAATAVLFTQHSYLRSGSQWLEVGDGLVTQEEVVPVKDSTNNALTIGENIIPSDACKRCYNGKAATNACEESLRSCFLYRPATALDTVYSLRQQQTQSGQNATNLRQSPTLIPLDSVFCAGFHALFVRPVGKCRWDARRTDVIAEGLRTSLLQNIREEIGEPDLTFESHYSIISEPVSENLRYVGYLPNNGKYYLPVAVDIDFVTRSHQKKVRQQIIRRAMNLLRRKNPGLSSIFTDKDKIEIKSWRRGKNRFVVIVEFNLRFKAEYLKEVPAR